MIVWLYSIVKNEAELLPYFLRHYRQVADKMIIYDHNSADGTPYILENSEAEVRQYAPEKYDDGLVAEMLTETCKEARGKADWIIVVDADEFLYHPNGMREMLQTALSGQANLVRTNGYSMISPWFPNGDGQIYDYCFHGVPDSTYSKPCIFSPNLDVTFSPGKHRIYVDGKVEQYYHPQTKLLHYRYFGRDWLKRRNKRNAEGLPERSEELGWGWHVRESNRGMYSADWYEQQKVERVVWTS